MILTSVSKKKSCSIAYRYVREGVATDEWRIEYISTDNNIADFSMKPIPSGAKPNLFVNGILHHIE